MLKIDTPKKKIAAGVLGFVAVVVLAGGAYYAWLLTPPAMPETMDQATAMMKSDRYQRLSDAQKRPYQDHVRELWGSLDRDQRHKLRAKIRKDKKLRKATRGAMKQYMINRARQFAKASDADRQKILEQFANRRGGRHRSHSDRNKNLTDKQKQERKQRREDRRGRFKGHMQDWATTGNPQHGAYMGEFFKAIHEYREQHGSGR